ncbi:hypothetical protein DAPPUDRAFT_245860 [Daphnia pulex]|uniref:Uncharacterized protein n=1 Tax=Daphnia pulex TaxID=6669 RepID=E9GP69_DAPPU|nr:hypothetical protein DAPPUDRAFT_245860 [Daphnia pulex]|eukprot:EFX78730.1 hypothetical protein DAPPUDRAFT_245860 [Daphnia pulex]
MVRITKDLLRRSNGRACLAYDELEGSLIETESVINETAELHWRWSGRSAPDHSESISQQSSFNLCYAGASSQSIGSRFNK